MEALTTLNNFAKTNTQKNVIQKHAEMVIRLAKDSFKEKNDFEDIKKNYPGLTGELQLMLMYIFLISF